MSKAEYFDSKRQSVMMNIEDVIPKTVFICLINTLEEAVSSLDYITVPQNATAHTEVYLKYEFDDSTKRRQWFIFGFVLGTKNIETIIGDGIYKATPVSMDYTADQMRDDVNRLLYMIDGAAWAAQL